jgi:hypothetical protein
MTMNIKTAIETLCAKLDAARERLAAIPEGGDRTEALAEIQTLKTRQDRVQHAYDAIWEDAKAAAPYQIRVNPNGSVTTIKGVLGGGSSETFPAGSAEAIRLIAEDAANRNTDAKVAEAAFAVWGWRGPVRIDYYGTSARVCRGAESLIIDLSKA